MGLKDEFEQALELSDRKVKAVAATVKTVWDNQVSLQNSIDMVEEEFCVLGRLLIPKVNEILVAIGSEDLITEEAINKTFLTWHEFKKRPDFKKHFVPWFLGRPLAEMPPVLEAKEEETSDAAPAQEDGGDIEFGGDYAQGQNSNLRDATDRPIESQSSEESPADAVSEG